MYRSYYPHRSRELVSPVCGIFIMGSAQKRKHALPLSCIFWLGHFLMSKISFESSFAQKCYIITVLIFFFRSVLERFGQNQKTCTFTFMRFLVRALPEVQNQFWKQFSNKVLYNYNSKFFFRSVSVRTRKSALSLSCIFCLGHFLRSKISFESSFLIKCYIITILKKIGSVSVRTRKSALSLSCIFWLGHFPKSKIIF